LSQLPVRGPLRPVEVGAESLTAIPAPEAPDAGDRHQIDELLVVALERLPSDDRVILKLRYLEGMRVADCDRALSMEQKLLYRSSDRALAALRQQIEASGISRAQAMAFIGALDQ